MSNEANRIRQTILELEKHCIRLLDYPLLDYPHMYVVKKPIIGYKKVIYRKTMDYWLSPSIMAIAVIEIPVGARVVFSVSDGNTSKLRASEALVKEFLNKRVKSATSLADPNFTYVPGKIVSPTKRFSVKNSVCNSGIHFFFKKAQAVAYRY